MERMIHEDRNPVDPNPPTEDRDIQTYVENNKENMYHSLTCLLNLQIIPRICNRADMSADNPCYPVIMTSYLPIIVDARAQKPFSMKVKNGEFPNIHTRTLIIVLFFIIFIVIYVLFNKRAGVFYRV